MSTPTVNRLLVKQVSWRAMLRAYPRRNEAVNVHEYADGALRLDVPLRRAKWMVPPVSWIFHLSDRKSIELNGIGAEIWRLCDGDHTVEDVVDAFAELYKLSFHEARVSVAEYIRRLIQRGILAIEMSPESRTESSERSLDI